MTPLLLTVALATAPVDIDLDTITVVAALNMDGQTVRTSFVIGKPSYTMNDTTVVGIGDREDGTEIAIYLPETDADDGDAITVEGVLRFRHHPATVINKQVIPEWDEIRIEDAKFMD